MRKFKYFIYADLVTTLTLLLMLLVWKLVIQGKPPGFVVIGLAVFLIINAAFCILSIAGINRGHQRRISNLWLSLISLVLFYFLLDKVGGYLFLQPESVDNPETHYNTADAYAHHILVPNMRGRMQTDDFDLAITTNNLGFRGKDIGERKDPSVYRILMLGDSFTMGKGVGDNDTFPVLVEGYLNKSGGRRYEVINCGTESYCPVLEYLQLKKYISILKPDLVVLNFDMSDLLNEYEYRSMASYDENGRVIAVNGVRQFNMMKESKSGMMFDWIRRNLFISQSVIVIINNYLGYEAESRHRMLLHTLKVPDLKDLNKMYSMVEDSILKIKELCGLYGCKFILSVYPWGHQVNNEEWMPGRYDFIPKGVGISDRTIQELERFSKAQGI